MQRKKLHGIVLVTTMCFLVIIIMMTTLIAAQGKAALQSGVASMQSEEAYMAALSGIDFVRGELRKEKTFGSEPFSKYTHKVENPTFPTPLYIRYDYPKINDITGLIGANSETDYKAKFYISFAMFPTFTSTTEDEQQGNLQSANYRHTSSACRYSSINRVNSSVGVDKSVDKAIRRDVPAYTIYIVSKGVCGKAVRYVEAFLTSAGSMAIDGGTTIGGKIRITGRDFSNYTRGERKEDESGNIIYENRNSLLTVDDVNKSNKGVLTAFGSNGLCDQTVELNPNGNLADIINLTNKVEIKGQLHLTNIPDEKLASNFVIGNNSIVDVDTLKSLTFDKAKDSINSGLTIESNKSELDIGSYIYLLEKDSNGDYTGAKWVFLSGVSNNDFSGTSGLSRTSYKNEVEGKIKIADETLGGLPVIYSNSYDGISFGYSDSNGIVVQDTPDKPNFASRTVVVSKNITAKGNISFAVVEKTVTETKTTDEETGEEQTIKTASYELLKDHTVDFRFKEGASIVSNGNIDINGEVIGNGNLIAKENVMFNSGSELEVGENEKVAVWAGKNINVANAKNVSNETWNELIKEYTGIGENGTGVNNISEHFQQRINNGTTAESIIEEIEKFNSGCSDDDVCVVTNVSKGDCKYNFTYNNHNYTIARKGVNKVKITIDGTESKNVKDLHTGKTLGDIYVTYKHPTGSACDFNIFLKYGDKYYHYGSVDFSWYRSKFSDGSPKHIDSDDRKTIGSFGRMSDLKVKIKADKKEKITRDLDIELAIAKQIASSKTSIKGTVYSEDGEITIDGGHNDFDILGALITCGGGLNITAGHVNLTYDPNYVPFFNDVGIKTNVNFVSSFIGGE